MNILVGLTHKIIFINSLELTFAKLIFTKTNGQISFQCLKFDDECLLSAITARNCQILEISKSFIYGYLSLRLLEYLLKELMKILLLQSKCEIIFASLFSIAPHLVKALPTLRQQKLSLFISLPKFLYEFCRLVHGFFSVLLPIYIDIALKGVSKK